MAIRAVAIVLLAVAVVVVFAAGFSIGAQSIGARQGPGATARASASASPVHPSAAPSSRVQLTWEAPAGSPSATERQQLSDAIRARVQAEQPNADRTVRISRAYVDASQAVLYGAEQTGTGQAVQSEGELVLLGVKSGATWRVVTARDADFCQVLQQLPHSLMSADGKAYFAGCRNGG